MRPIRQSCRTILLLLHLLVGVFITLMLRGRKDAPPTARGKRLIAWWHGRTARILGLRIKARGAVTRAPVLVVANHASWMDILVLGNLTEASFVSKSEIRNWPIIGRLAARTGTLFIDRGARDAAARAAEQITWRLRRGESVIVFPEATLAPGESVRHFHPRLFASAVRAECAVQPVGIYYARTPDGRAPAAYRDESLARNTLRVMAEQRLDVAVTFCAPLDARALSRDQLADRAETMVRNVVERGKARTTGHGTAEAVPDRES